MTPKEYISKLLNGIYICHYSSSYLWNNLDKLKYYTSVIDRKQSYVKNQNRADKITCIAVDAGLLLMVKENTVDFFEHHNVIMEALNVSMKGGDVEDIERVMLDEAKIPEDATMFFLGKTDEFDSS